jgi:hypothetical protein
MERAAAAFLPSTSESLIGAPSLHEFVMRLTAKQKGACNGGQGNACAKSRRPVTSPQVAPTRFLSISKGGCEFRAPSCSTFALFSCIFDELNSHSKIPKWPQDNILVILHRMVTCMMHMRLHRRILHRQTEMLLERLLESHPPRLVKARCLC